ncbi:MAG: 50S ribosomal protein L23 [Candidatus Diapherotrites archaeon]
MAAKKEGKKKEHEGKGKPAQKKEKKAEKKTATAKKEEAKKVAIEKKEIVEKVKEEAKKISIEEQLNALEILKYPLISEKAVNMIESENKLCFIVDQRASKADVKKAVEGLYAVKVDRVNIIHDMRARKKALVKINKAFKAQDVATKLGVL